MSLFGGVPKKKKAKKGKKSGA